MLLGFDEGPLKKLDTYIRVTGDVLHVVVADGLYPMNLDEGELVLQAMMRLKKKKTSP